MGFFNDLRKDISQAVNELLPDEEFFGLDEQSDSSQGGEISEAKEQNKVEDNMGDMLSELSDLSGTDMESIQIDNENNTEKEESESDKDFISELEELYVSDTEEQEKDVEEQQDEEVLSQQDTDSSGVNASVESPEEDDIHKMIASIQSFTDALVETDHLSSQDEELSLDELDENVVYEENDVDVAMLSTEDSKSEDDAIVDVDTDEKKNNNVEEKSLPQIEQDEVAISESEHQLQEAIEEAIVESEMEEQGQLSNSMEVSEPEKIDISSAEEVNTLAEEVERESNISMDTVEEEKKESNILMGTVEEEEKESNISMDTTEEVSKVEESILDENAEETEAKKNMEKPIDALKEDFTETDLTTVVEDNSKENDFEASEDFAETSLVKKEDMTTEASLEETKDTILPENVNKETSSVEKINDKEKVTMEVNNIEEKEVNNMENNLENVEVKDEVTVITKGTVINGSISSDGGLEINGTITGDVECLGKLTINGTVSGNLKAADVVVSTPRLDGGIESKGDVKIGVGTIVLGDVTAKSATVSGAVRGEIDVNGPVVVDSTAIVKGNITAKSVQINNGAVVDGYCKLAYADVDIDNFFDGE